MSTVFDELYQLHFENPAKKDNLFTPCQVSEIGQYSQSKEC